MSKKSIQTQIADILDEYGDQASDTIAEIAEEVAKDTVKELKRTSPKSKQGGKHYASGWTVDITKTRGGQGVTTTVYNKSKPQLTHLLENGHAIANQYGTYGRTGGIPHIAPAEEKANEEFLRRLEEALKK